MVLSVPILSTLFGYGAFTPRDVLLSSQSLTAYAFGLPFFVLIKVLAPGFFARGDTATPVRVGMATLGVNLCLNLALMRPLQHVGPPLATSLASAINAVVLALLLFRRGFLQPDRSMLSRLARMAVAAGVMAVLLAWLSHGVFHDLPQRHGLVRVAELGTLTGCGMLTYGLLLQVLGVIDLRTLPGRLAARLRRRTRPPVQTPSRLPS